MTETEYRRLLAQRGYGAPQPKTYPPHTDGPLHTHDEAVLLFVLAGEFSLAEPDRVTRYLPGELLDLPAGCLHAERAGPDGASVLLAKK